MTGYTVHTGASEKFVSGWDRVFSGPAAGSAGRSRATAKKKAAGPKKAAAKKAAPVKKKAAKKKA